MHSGAEFLFSTLSVSLWAHLAWISTLEQLAGNPNTTPLHNHTITPKEQSL
jgi:hypothetical protein